MLILNSETSAKRDPLGSRDYAGQAGEKSAKSVKSKKSEKDEKGVKRNFKSQSSDFRE
jgi:hypothetical protein